MSTDNDNNERHESITKAIAVQQLGTYFEAQLADLLRSVPMPWAKMNETERLKWQEWIERRATAMEENIAGQTHDIVERAIAKGRPNWTGKLRKLTTDSNKVEITINGSESEAPDCLFRHHGSVLVVVTERAMSLEELQGQIELPMRPEKSEDAVSGSSGDIPSEILQAWDEDDTMKGEAETSDSDGAADLEDGERPPHDLISAIVDASDAAADDDSATDGEDEPPRDPDIEPLVYDSMDFARKQGWELEDWTTDHVQVLVGKCRTVHCVWLKMRPYIDQNKLPNLPAGDTAADAAE